MHRDLLFELEVNLRTNVAYVREQILILRTHEFEQ